MFYATRQWANPGGFAHKRFGRVLLSLSQSARRLLVLVRFDCCGGSGPAPTLPTLGSSYVQLPEPRPSARAAVRGPSVLVLGGSEVPANGFCAYPHVLAALLRLYMFCWNLFEALY